MQLYSTTNPRFIPTCVGNTHDDTRLTYSLSVHPHVRGEYNLQIQRFILLNGSSPRAWGIRFLLRNAGRVFRFIPTCVGNTISCPALPCPGSSPRAWGIPKGAKNACFGIRFIPTCVGNTFFSLVRCLLLAVHPHVRGEYFMFFHDFFDILGSSPRAWGIRCSIS